MARLLAYVVAGAAVFFGSFFITLWLTAPPVVPMPADGRTGLQRFETLRISSYSEISDGAYRAGLQESQQMRGNVDGINHVNDHEASIGGWLADPHGSGTPLHVLVFVGGPLVADVQTKGERPDVTAAVQLGFGAEKNVAFSFKFACTPGVQPVVVGVSDKGQYIPLPTKKCP